MARRCIWSKNIRAKHISNILGSFQAFKYSPCLPVLAVVVQVFVSPWVLLLYPVWILPVTLGLGLYGGLSQVGGVWRLV